MTKKNKPEDKKIFSEETMMAIMEYGAVLREIHNRLVKEGKVKVVDGKSLFLDEKTGEWLDGEATKNKRKNI